MNDSSASIDEPPGPPAAPPDDPGPTLADLVAGRERDRERAAHLRMAIESMGGFAYEWDPATGAVERIGRVQALLGVEPTGARVTIDAAGWAERVHPDDAPDVWARIRAALDDPARDGWHHEYRVRRADGRFGWIADVARIVRDADGRAVRVVGAATDVDARRSREEMLAAANAQLRQFVEDAPAAIAMFDNDMRYLAASRRYAEAYQLRTVDLVGRSHYEIFPDIPEHWRGVHARVLAGETMSADQEPFPRADGTLDWVRWTMRPWHAVDGTVGGAMLLSEVITDEHARQAERERLLTAERAARRDAEAARAELESMLAAISDAFFMLDCQWRFTYVNAQAERVLGRPRAELLGRSIWEAFAPAVDSEFFRAYHRAMSSGRPAAFEAYYAPLDAWLDVRAYPGPKGLAVYFQDVSARHAADRALAASEARLRAVFEAAPVGILVAQAPSGRIVGGNQRAEAIFGHPILETPDISSYGRWISFHADGSPVDPREYPLARVITGGEPRAELEVLYRRGDERLAWVRLVASAVHDPGTGALAGGVLVALDVDAERRASQALREADARKDEFLAVLAHELRNPLAPIRNAVRLLQRGQSLSDTGQVALAMIERQSAHMTRLVDDLLEISRINRGKIELRREPMLLATAVSHVVEAMLSVIEARRQTLDVVQPSRPVRVMADSVRLHQVLTNLLSNASKFTPEGGRIRIEVEETPDAAVVRVIDDGTGIAPEALERIFELFSQAEQTLDRSAGGLGIGLAMVRRLVELHGGSVHAESDGPGKGSTFVVRLPKAAGNPGAMGTD